MRQVSGCLGILQGIVAISALLYFPAQMDFSQVAQIGRFLGRPKSTLAVESVGIVMMHPAQGQKS
jgi:hypothetical protein